MPTVADSGISYIINIRIVKGLGSPYAYACAKNYEMAEKCPSATDALDLLVPEAIL